MHTAVRKFSRYIRIRVGKLIIGNRFRNLTIKEWKSIQFILTQIWRQVKHCGFIGTKNSWNKTSIPWTPCIKILSILIFTNFKMLVSTTFNSKKETIGSMCKASIFIIVLREILPPQSEVEHSYMFISIINVLLPFPCTLSYC